MYKFEPYNLGIPFDSDWESEYKFPYKDEFSRAMPSDKDYKSQATATTVQEPFDHGNKYPDYEKTTSHLKSDKPGRGVHEYGYSRNKPDMWNDYSEQSISKRKKMNLAVKI